MSDFMIEHKGGLFFAGVGDDHGVEKPVWSPVKVCVFDTREAAQSTLDALRNRSDIARDAHVKRYVYSRESVRVDLSGHEL